MSARVYASRVDAERLEQLLASLHPEVPFAIVEKLDEIDFPARDAAIDPQVWRQGRLFGPKAELRWEAQGEVFRVWLTKTDGTEPPQGFEERRNLDGYEVERRDYLLRREGREVNLGRPLRYRALEPGEGPAYLIVEEFYDQAGRLVYYRYAGMERR